MGLPLPKRPIWLKEDELQLGGWQIAVIEAAPGKSGVTVPPEAAGMVVGAVETNSRLRPVRIVPFLSVTTEVMGCVLFWLTTTLVTPGVPVTLGTLKAMETGGQVEKKPAELAACERLALMTVEPGACAVATPFSSMDTMPVVCAV